MSEQSNSPLVKKLGIKEDHAVHLVDEPDGFRELLVGLPLGVDFSGESNLLDVIILFTTTNSALKAVPALKKRLRPGGGLWIAWPKKTSGVATDVTFEAVQTPLLKLGLVDNKICAIDSTWTALRFVYRKEDRKKLEDKPKGRR